ncbi:MAG: hypothetical protein JWN14_919 [Chthonomonadales bacterium]|nr:hypothetical protein [Chthonomonadales bacterium]
MTEFTSTGENHDALSADEQGSEDLWTSASPHEANPHMDYDHVHAHTHEAHDHASQEPQDHSGEDGQHAEPAGHRMSINSLGVEVAANLIAIVPEVMHVIHTMTPETILLHMMAGSDGVGHEASHASVQAIVPHQATWDPHYFQGVGQPFEDGSHWHEQQGDSSCAVVSQMAISEALTHHTFSEEQVCRFAQEHHWFDPESGTPPEHADKILNALGIETEKGYHASLGDMADALEHGDKVLVCVNANAIWTPLRDTETGAPVLQSNAGHALWVTGIDEAPDGSLKIIINDSGTPNGQMVGVDMADFLNGWNEYDHFMVVAHAPTEPMV